MDNLDFKTEFVIDFDDILIRNDNPLVNSYEHYIKYKNNYLEETELAMQMYTNATRDLDQHVGKQYIRKTPSKVLFTNVDNVLITELKHQRKEILKQQQHRLSQFMQFINKLNEDYVKIAAPAAKDSPSRPASINSIESKRSKRGLFSRFKR